MKISLKPVHHFSHLLIWETLYKYQCLYVTIKDGCSLLSFSNVPLEIYLHVSANARDQIVISSSVLAPMTFLVTFRCPVRYYKKTKWSLLPLFSEPYTNSVEPGNCLIHFCELNFKSLFISIFRNISSFSLYS